MIWGPEPRDEVRQTPEAGMCKKTNSLLDSPEGTQACQHLDRNPAKQISDFCPTQLKDNKLVMCKPGSWW